MMQFRILVFYFLLLSVIYSCKCKTNINEKERRELQLIIEGIEKEDFKGYKIGPVERRKNKILFKRPDGKVFYVRKFDINNSSKLVCLKGDSCHKYSKEIYDKLSSLHKNKGLAVNFDEGIRVFYTCLKNKCYRLALANVLNEDEKIRIVDFYDNSSGELEMIKENWYLFYTKSFLEYDEIP